VEEKMLGRFLKFYKKHMGLFILDMGVAVISAAISILFPFITRKLIQVHIANKDLKAIILSISILIAIFLMKAILNYIRIKWGHILGVRMEYDMRSDIFSHLQKLSFTYYDNTKTGHIMSRISNDLNMIAEVAHHAPEDLLISIVTIIGAYFFMFSINFKLALISLIPLPIMLAWGLTLGKAMKSGFRNLRKKIADINSTVENSVQGIREVKSYANEDLEIEKFGEANTNFKIAKEIMYHIMAVFHSGMSFFRDLYYLLIIAAGGYLIYKGQSNLTDLLTFTLYVGIILPPIDRLINFVEQLQQGMASFERFTEIMDIEPDIKDHPQARKIKKIDGEITIENIKFKYESSPDWILNNVSLSIKKGEKIAIVGESGAGKSTIVSLIPRFYETNDGIIKIDNIDVNMIKQESLRKNIGIVQQNVFLFDASIRDNILYGKPDATYEEMVQATKDANIYEFIMSLPDNFNTEVGERGIKLSGGQKQRISIARAFLKNPPIIIFDEATSSLDTESENLIQQSMDNLSKDRTTIIIAHRLSTVKNVNRIFVLNKGELAESGTHSELLERDGFYANLYRKGQL